MPAFTFEKISPPVRRGPIPPIVKKQRGLIVQILDSFVDARVKSIAKKGRHRPHEKKPPTDASLRHSGMRPWRNRNQTDAHSGFAQDARPGMTRSSRRCISRLLHPSILQMPPQDQSARAIRRDDALRLMRQQP